MITCSKVTSLTVNDACPDWSQLVCPQPGAPVVTAVQASFSPLAGDMHVFAASINHGAFDPNAQSLNIAKLSNYNKAACNCNLHLVWAISSFAEIHLAQVFFNVDGPSVNLTNTPSGTYDFPFTLHSGIVTPYDITFTVNLTVSQVFFQALSMSLTGTITNV